VSVTEVAVDVDPGYTVRVGPGCLAGVAELAAGYPRHLVVSDERVLGLHGEALAALAGPRHALPRGEAAKRFGVLEAVLDAAAAAGLDRGSLVVTLGGGSVADVGGLAAALYMRGVAVLHAPTTLLAQVDAAVGGKTAVNLAAGKNLAGIFHQPVAVFADTATLATLEAEDFRSGLGEAAKTALLEPGTLIRLLEGHAAAVAARDPEVLAAVVVACVRTKAAVVAADEREHGARRTLNLGHTFAHAFEHAAGYGRVPHGLAVAAGIGAALRCSAALGVLLDAELPARWRALARALELPADPGELRAERGLALEPEDLLAAMALDKKARGASPLLVLPRAVGRCEIDVPADRELLLAALA